MTIDEINISNSIFFECIDKFCDGDNTKREFLINRFIYAKCWDELGVFGIAQKKECQMVIDIFLRYMAEYVKEIIINA